MNTSLIMKKHIKNIIAHSLLCLLALVILVPLVFIPIGNDLILNRYARELKHYPVGCEYKVLATEKVCGKLYGNGNDRLAKVEHVTPYE